MARKCMCLSTRVPKRPLSLSLSLVGGTSHTHIRGVLEEQHQQDSHFTHTCALHARACTGAVTGQYTRYPPPGHGC